MESVFWAGLALVLYTYLGYPLALALAIRVKRRRHRLAGNAPLPRITVIISAYNEERDLDRKLANTLSLDYPRELLELMVGSDGSTDGTNAIVRSYADRGVKLQGFTRNRGKTAVQNDCALQATGEILVFMDAAAPCNRSALRELANHFSDETVGCVAGRIVYVTSRDNLVEQGQETYWAYETMLRDLEGRLGALVGVDGPLYAIRRASYVEVHPDAMSDLMAPLLVRGSGKRVVFEPHAVAYEQATRSGYEEFQTRRRVVLRGLNSLWRYRQLLNPFENPALAVQIFSHKVLRWAVILSLAGMSVSAAALSEHTLFRAFVICLTGLVGTGLVGVALAGTGRAPRMLRLPYYFCLVNLAAGAGIVDFLRSKELISWTPARIP